MSDDETTPEMLARLGTDAMLWAQEFNKTAVKLGYSEMDEGWLIGWFANAIENCDVIRCNQLRAELAAEREQKFRHMDNSTKLCNEITRLRVENERLRRLVERIVEHHEHDESEVSGWTQWEALVKDARAALEGVTEPQTGGGNGNQ